MFEHHYDGFARYWARHGMSPQTLERPRSAGPGSGTGGSWKVIVRNDDHNTFDHVAATLARVIPGVSLEARLRARQRYSQRGTRDRLEPASASPPSITGSSCAPPA